MNAVKNIYCVGRNYVEHVKELQNKIPDHPVIFSKPTHALVKADGSTIQLPNDKGDIHYEAELVIHINEEYTPEKTVEQLVDKMALGIDLTLRDVQQQLKNEGYPWLLSKGFPNSAIITDFIPFPGVTQCTEKDFTLEINDAVVQVGNVSQMMFSIHTLIKYIGTNLGLNKGDIIFTGTPSGVGPLRDNDRLTLKWGDEILGHCTVKF